MMNNRFFLKIMLAIIAVGWSYVYYNAYARTSNNIRVVVFNPYSFDTQLKVKCDWRNSTGRWRLNKIYSLDGKKKVAVSVPNDIKRCEIWPKVGKF